MGTEAELATFKSPHDVIVKTQRLRLRPVSPMTDIHVIHRMRQNPNGMKYMYVVQPLDLSSDNYLIRQLGPLVLRQKKTPTKVSALIE